MAQTSLAFLLSPKKAQALAAAPRLESRPAWAACILMLFIFAAAIWFTTIALMSRPLEGFLNLGELAAAALVGSYLLQKLKLASEGVSDGLKRLCLVISSIAAVWICAGALLLSLFVIIRGDVNSIGTGAIIVELAFWSGMLVHAFRAVSRVAALMRGAAGLPSELN